MFPSSLSQSFWDFSTVGAFLSLYWPYSVNLSRINGREPDQSHNTWLFSVYRASGKPLLCRAVCPCLLSHTCRELISHLVMGTHGAYISLGPTTKLVRFFSCPTCLKCCLQRGGGILKSYYTGSQEETVWREHVEIQPSVSNVIASLQTHMLTERTCKSHVSASELQSSQQQSNSHCTETSNSWMQSGCQLGFRAPSELHWTLIST